MTCSRAGAEGARERSRQNDARLSFVARKNETWNRNSLVYQSQPHIITESLQTKPQHCGLQFDIHTYSVRRLIQYCLVAEGTSQKAKWVSREVTSLPDDCDDLREWGVLLREQWMLWVCTSIQAWVHQTYNNNRKIIEISKSLHFASKLWPLQR